MSSCLSTALETCLWPHAGCSSARKEVSARSCVRHGPHESWLYGSFVCPRRGNIAASHGERYSTLRNHTWEVHFSHKMNLPCVVLEGYSAGSACNISACYRSESISLLAGGTQPSVDRRAGGAAAAVQQAGTEGTVGACCLESTARNSNIAAVVVVQTHRDGLAMEGDFRHLLHKVTGDKQSMTAGVPGVA